MGYRLNPSAQIVADTHLALRFGSDKAIHVELIDSPTLMDGLYKLATLRPDDLDRLVRHQELQDQEVMQALRFANLLVRTDDRKIEPDPLAYAFSLKYWEDMRSSAASAVARCRDGVHIVDRILPEEARSSIAIWARTLPYRRIDIDRPDSHDLHRIFAMSPPLNHVRSVPFLRAIDEKICALLPVLSPTIFRAYVYDCSSADVFRVHSDSTISSDITAIYFPALWQDHLGGELLFYDGGEPRWVVAPQANRLVIFQGIREHRVAPISHVGNFSRYSIVLRYSAVAIDEERS